MINNSTNIQQLEETLDSAAPAILETLADSAGKLGNTELETRLREAANLEADKYIEAVETLADLRSRL